MFRPSWCLVWVPKLLVPEGLREVQRIVMKTIQKSGRSRSLIVCLMVSTGKEFMLSFFQKINILSAPLRPICVPQIAMFERGKATAKRAIFYL